MFKIAQLCLIALLFNVCFAALRDPTQPWDANAYISHDTQNGLRLEMIVYGNAKRRYAVINQQTVKENDTTTWGHVVAIYPNKVIIRRFDEDKDETMRLIEPKVKQEIKKEIKMNGSNE